MRRRLLYMDWTRPGLLVLRAACGACLRLRRASSSATRPARTKFHLDDEPPGPPEIMNHAAIHLSLPEHGPSRSRLFRR